MSRIIYTPSSDENSYVIDKRTQEILSYLYLYSAQSHHDIVENTSVDHEGELFERIKDCLLIDTTGFAAVRGSDQLTIHGDRTITIELTTEGEKFVEQYKSEIAVPFSVEQHVNKIRDTQEEIKSDLAELNGALAALEDTEATELRLEELMDRIEDHFDYLRSESVSPENFPPEE